MSGPPLPSREAWNLANDMIAGSVKSPDYPHNLEEADRKVAAKRGEVSKPEVTQADIELLAQITEAGGNEAAAFTLRSVGAVGTVLEAQTQVLARHRLNATPSRQDGLREALEEIADPIGAMRRDAEALGRRLEGGVAYSLSNDPNYLKEIARKALAERPKIGHASGCVKINCAGCGTDFYSTDYSRAALSDIPPPDNEETASGEAEVLLKPGLSEADERVEFQRLAYKTGYNEGYSDASGGLVDRDASEEGWGQYHEKLEAMTEAEHLRFIDAAYRIHDSAFNNGGK